MRTEIFLIYLLVVNLTGLLFFYADKQKAIQHRYRIPERRLFFIALAGGAVGCLAGMYLFHHKTKHARFVIGMPLLSLIWLLIIFAFFRSANSDSAGPFFHTLFYNLSV